MSSWKIKLDYCACAITLIGGHLLGRFTSSPELAKIRDSGMEEEGGVKAEAAGGGMSEYELKRLERIKENKKMLEELFPDGTGLQNGVCGTTPERKRTPRKSGGSRKFIKRTVEMYPRRNPSRKARPAAPDKGRAVTRARAKEEGEAELMDGLEDEQEVKRVVYRTIRRVSSQEVLPIELDDEPAYSGRIKAVERSSDKVYDKVNGSTCHQCRQKTNDTKTFCHNKNCSGTRGQFCGPCLQNRYGEDLKEALRDKEWVCPPCRGFCNCSFCLPKRGKPPTGILIHLARESGYDSVREYLDKTNYDY